MEAKSIKISSCYSKVSKFTSSNDAFLKNVHGDTTVKSSGKSFKLSGFSGVMRAELGNEDIEIQLSNLMNESEIKSIHPNANIKLGLSDSVISQTNIKILSDASMESCISELMVCYIKKRKLYEIQRTNLPSKHLLNFIVKGGKSVELSKMSWIDFLKFV